jgi:hypothetical protein
VIIPFLFPDLRVILYQQAGLGIYHITSVRRFDCLYLEINHLACLNTLEQFNFLLLRLQQWLDRIGQVKGSPHRTILVSVKRTLGSADPHGRVDRFRRQ